MSTRILVYDGDCAFCSATSERLVTEGWIAESERRPFASFGADDARRLQGAGFRDGVAVLDLATREVRTGVAALVWLFEGRAAPWWVALARPRLLRPFARLVYRAIAVNRRRLPPGPGRGGHGEACPARPRGGGGARDVR